MLGGSESYGSPVGSTFTLLTQSLNPKSASYAQQPGCIVRVKDIYLCKRHLNKKAEKKHTQLCLLLTCWVQMIFFQDLLKNPPTALSNQISLNSWFEIQRWISAVWSDLLLISNSSTNTLLLYWIQQLKGRAFMCTHIFIHLREDASVKEEYLKEMHFTDRRDSLQGYKMGQVPGFMGVHEFKLNATSSKHLN